NLYHLCMHEQADRRSLRSFPTRRSSDLMMAPASFLTPIQVARSFGDDVWRLSAIEVAFFIGMIIGGGVIASWGGFKNRVITQSFAGVIMGVSTIALGVVPLFSIYLMFMLLFGVAVPIYNTPASVLLQEKEIGRAQV